MKRNLKKILSNNVKPQITYSYLLKQSIESEHKPLEALNYERIGTVYRKNTKKRKLSEALFIKELKPTLNKKSLYH